jgi:hypothetical protein
MRGAMAAHGPLLMCFHDEIAQGAPGTEQSEASLAIFGEIRR